MISFRPQARRRVRHAIGAAAMLCGLGASGLSAQASPACDAVNSGGFNFSAPASDAASSSVLTSWQTGEKVTLSFTDAINATHAEGVYQGGNIAPRQTVTVPAGSNAGLSYTIASSDLLNGILLDPENNDAVTASCTVTTLLATSTALATSANPIGIGYPVQFSATVSGSGSPSGLVAFYDNGALLGTSAISGGTATFSLNVLGEGFHSITATYLGDAAFTSSMSAALTQAVEIFSAKPRRRF